LPKNAQCCGLPTLT
jgi:GH18 family chitinase